MGFSNKTINLMQKTKMINQISTGTFLLEPQKAKCQE
jgi:hypothetical protein